MDTSIEMGVAWIGDSMVKRLNAAPGMRKFKAAFGDVKVEPTVLHAPQS